MTDWEAKLACVRSKEGESFRDIGYILGRSEGQVKELIGQAVKLTPQEIEGVILMKERGHTLEEISRHYFVDVGVLNVFLTESDRQGMGSQLHTTRQADEGERREGMEGSYLPTTFSQVRGSYIGNLPRAAPDTRVNEAMTKQSNELPAAHPLAVSDYSRQSATRGLHSSGQFEQVNSDNPESIVSYQLSTNKLHWTDLVYGEQSSYQLPSYHLKLGCCCSELPDASILITGGGDPGRNEVVKVDARTFEVSKQAPMHTARVCHTSVYHAQFLYILGGLNDRYLSECERYVCATRRWEALPPLPEAACGVSGVVMAESLYALGGAVKYDDSLDCIQKLSLEWLTWSVLEVRLPERGTCIASFKADSQVYFVMKKTLYSFTPSRIHAVKPVSEGIRSYYGPSYYSRGTLYCSNNIGAARKWKIGGL
jgi:hypothetical protein